MSSPPNVSFAKLIMCSTPSSVATSACTNAALPPLPSILPTVSRPRPSSMSFTTTCAPSSASRRAKPRPMPYPAPVTRATLSRMSMLVLARSEDARSRRSGGDKLPVGGRELALEEGDGVRLVNDVALRDDRAGPRRTDKVHLHLDRRGELIRWKRGEQRRAHRVVEHRRQKAALDGAVRVTELRSSRVLNADVAGLKVERLPAEQRRRRRRFDEPVGGGAEDVEAGDASSRGHCAGRPSRSHGVYVTPNSMPSGLSSLAVVCPHGSIFVSCSTSTPRDFSSATAPRTSSTSNSIVTCGRGRPSGHSSAPKVLLAASFRVHSPKCLTPSRSATE